MNDEQYRKYVSDHWGQNETIKVLRPMFAEGRSAYDYLNNRLKAEKHDEDTLNRLMYEVVLNSNDKDDVAKTVKMLVEEYGARSVSFELNLTARQLFLCKANHEMYRYLKERSGVANSDDLVVTVWARQGANRLCDLKDYCAQDPDLKQYVDNLAKMPLSSDDEQRRFLIETFNNIQCLFDK